MDSLQAYRSTRTDKPPNGAGLARGLGAFSLALGAAELVRPHAIARLAGIPHGPVVATVIRALGAREITNGVGIFAKPRHALPLWARVVGDAIDLAFLGAAGRARGRKGYGRLAGAALVVAGVMAVDVIAARRARRGKLTQPILYSVTINKPPEEVYAFFRKLDRLPAFMDHLVSVTEHGETSHWVAKLPVVGTVAWDAKITTDRPGEEIAWESVPGSKIKQCGRVTFARTPGRNATEVRLEWALGVRGTTANEALAKALAKPQAKGDLKRFKQVIETGEVLYSDASEHVKPYPAQPARHGEHKHPRLFVANPPTARKGGVS